ncbi:hypothetical protein BS1321_23400 [Peribacillus simplex NBRC 15720 = DSM 1321]|uniref:Uncharacterized protein n=3 Tax=Peribacillus simplex TaxID=1478 RepID=A0A223EN29_9BACI|nr:hypothetical protein [Peribacillus simplex]ASS96591.1 hypothetical protein BS1321_23400 [Peribacillus simplex NBRC 15720 = DSM 1321]MED3912553.1 hypothetical protein [Peribacillus simplex]TVX79504.1 hypothetical protein FQP34_15050 [Peribacillus simplex]
MGIIKIDRYMGMCMTFKSEIIKICIAIVITFLLGRTVSQGIQIELLRDIVVGITVAVVYLLLIIRFLKRSDDDE